MVVQHGFKKDAKKTVKYLNKAKEIACKKGDGSVLEKSDLENIDRYLLSYEPPSNSKGSESKSMSSGSSVPSQIEHSAQCSISALTPNSS